MSLARSAAHESPANQAFSPIAMPDVYSKGRNTEDELWQQWNSQGDQYMALGGLIARLKELTARAGQKWTSSSQAK